MKQTEHEILTQISSVIAGQTAAMAPAIPVGEIGFSDATAISNDAVFDFDPTQDVLLFDGEPVNENGLPQGVQAFENTDGNTVVQFQNGDTQTLHGASYDDFMNFIDDITLNAAADPVNVSPTGSEDIQPDFNSDDFIDFGDGKMLPLLQFDPEAQADGFDTLDDNDSDFDNIFLF